MESKTILVALGGNALIKQGQIGTIEQQLKNVDSVMGDVAMLIKRGWRVVITHGNGPQVGNLLLQQQEHIPKMPLYVCVAESQGQIGYMIQEALYNKLHKIRVNKPVVTLITQVLVDNNDKAFKRPTKPIGPYYQKEDDVPIEWHMIKTPKGFRRVVPSPEPREIIEKDIIKDAVKRVVVIACGGGGIPVIKGGKGPGLFGVDAVIDKDLTAQKLAGIVNADIFAILTNVDRVYLNYRGKDHTGLKSMDLSDARKYLKKGHFPPGSMGPKITAAIRFLEKNRKGKVIITRFQDLDEALKGRAGTIITSRK